MRQSWHNQFGDTITLTQIEDGYEIVVTIANGKSALIPNKAVTHDEALGAVKAVMSNMLPVYNALDKKA